MITFQGKGEIARLLEALMPGQLEGASSTPPSPPPAARPVRLHPSSEVTACSSRTVTRPPTPQPTTVPPREQRDPSPGRRPRLKRSRASAVGQEAAAGCPADTQEGVDGSWASGEFGRRRRKSKHDFKSESWLAQRSRPTTTNISRKSARSTRSTSQGLSDSSPSSSDQSRPVAQRRAARSQTGWQGILKESAAVELGEPAVRYEGPLDIPETHIAATQRLRTYQLDASLPPGGPAIPAEPPPPTPASRNSVDSTNSSDTITSGAPTRVHVAHSYPSPTAWSSWAASAQAWDPSLPPTSRPRLPILCTSIPMLSTMYSSLGLTDAGQSDTQAPDLEAAVGIFATDRSGRGEDWDGRFTRSNRLGSTSSSSGNAISNSSDSTFWTGAPSSFISPTPYTSTQRLISPFTEGPTSTISTTPDLPKTPESGTTDVLSELSECYLSGRYRDAPRGTIKWDIISPPPPPRESLQEFPFMSPSPRSGGESDMPCPSPETSPVSRVSFVVRTDNRPK